MFTHFSFSLTKPNEEAPSPENIVVGSVETHCRRRTLTLSILFIRAVLH